MQLVKQGLAPWLKWECASLIFSLLFVETPCALKRVFNTLRLILGCSAGVHVLAAIFDEMLDDLLSTNQNIRVEWQVQKFDKLTLIAKAVARPNVEEEQFTDKLFCLPDNRFGLFTARRLRRVNGSVAPQSEMLSNLARVVFVFEQSDHPIHS
jgi:hypothetical protein